MDIKRFDGLYVLVWDTKDLPADIQIMPQIHYMVSNGRFVALDAMGITANGRISLVAGNKFTFYCEWDGKFAESGWGPVVPITNGELNFIELDGNKVSIEGTVEAFGLTINLVGERIGVLNGQ